MTDAATTLTVPAAGSALYPTVMVTGHRPKGLTVAEAAWAQVTLARTAHRFATGYGTRVAVSGMALGADTWWAVAAVAAGLRLHAYIPFTSQPDTWPPADQAVWRMLRHVAEHEVVVGGHDYDVRQLHARNDAMLAVADLVVAVCKPGAGGGTASTVAKARARGLPLLLLDPTSATITPEGWTPLPRP